MRLLLLILKWYFLAYCDYSKKTTSKPKKEVLVIPLISKNEWRIDKKADDQQDRVFADNDNKDGKTEETVDKPPVSLEEQAVKELLEGSSSKTSSDKKNSKTIPILFQNKVPDGYEEDDNMDVSLRPEQVFILVYMWNG